MIDFRWPKHFCDLGVIETPWRRDPPMQQTDPAALPLERKASLLSGGDFWSTQPLDEAGVPAVVLTDGPHGIRRQKAGADHLGFHASEPATCFPPAVAVGSSWDAELAARVGEAV